MSAPSITVVPPGTTAWFRRPRVLDTIVFVVSVTAVLTEATLIPLRASNGGYAALAVAAAGVVVARRFLWIGLVLTALAPLLDAALGYEPIALWTIAIFTAMSVALRGLPAVWVAIVVALPAYGAIVWRDRIGPVDPIALTAVAFSFAAAAVGSAVRSRYRYWQEVEQRARDEIANREADMNRRIAEERLRIARDLHDVVGHEVAVLSIHLGVLEVNLPSGSADARAALEASRGGVQTILHETQRILQLLRTGQTDPDDVSRPAPEFAGIASLVDSRRQAGVSIEASLSDVPSDLDAEVGTAAYRIVQEAITNFQRHGSGALTLVVSVETGVLTILASNRRSASAVGPAGGSAGFGLVGMRERVSSVGGRLVVDDLGAEFRVIATLPVRGGAHA